MFDSNSLFVFCVDRYAFIGHGNPSLLYMGSYARKLVTA
jgi:hypothetical protein